MSNLVEHAKRELDLVSDDEEWKASIIKAVEGFCTYGHSGSSAPTAISCLHRLLQYKELSPVTDDPDEWVQQLEDVWQSKRNPAYLSEDGGKTFTDVNEDDSEYPITYESKRINESE